MRYFTRALLQFVQDLNEGTPEEIAEHRQIAQRRWEEAEGAYWKYVEQNATQLRKRARPLIDLALHDSVVTNANIRGDSVEVMLDTRYAPAVDSDTVRLQFFGVSEIRGIAGLEGQIWLHEEIYAHPDSTYECDAILEHSELHVRFHQVEASSGAACKRGEMGSGLEEARRNADRA